MGLVSGATWLPLWVQGALVWGHQGRPGGLGKGSEQGWGVKGTGVSGSCMLCPSAARECGVSPTETNSICPQALASMEGRKQSGQSRDISHPGFKTWSCRGGSPAAFENLSSIFSFPFQLGQ
jgi:hypothetical protein